MLVSSISFTTSISLFQVLAFLCYFSHPKLQFGAGYPAISLLWKPQHRQHRYHVIIKATRAEEPAHTIYFTSRLSKFSLGEKNVCRYWIISGRWNSWKSLNIANQTTARSITITIPVFSCVYSAQNWIGTSLWSAVFQ